LGTRRAYKSGETSAAHPDEARLMMTCEETSVLVYLKSRRTATMSELARHGWNDRTIADLELFGMVSVFYEKGRRSLVQITDRGAALGDFGSW